MYLLLEFWYTSCFKFDWLKCNLTRLILYICIVHTYKNVETSSVDEETYYDIFAFVKDKIS